MFFALQFFKLYCFVIFVQPSNLPVTSQTLQPWGQQPWRTSTSDMLNVSALNMLGLMSRIKLFTVTMYVPWLVSDVAIGCLFQQGEWCEPITLRPPNEATSSTPVQYWQHHPEKLIFQSCDYEAYVSLSGLARCVCLGANVCETVCTMLYNNHV